MFIRRSTYTLADAFNSSEGQAEFERDMRASIKPLTLDGLINSTHVKNEDGSWAVVAIWESQEQADAATPRIMAQWKRLSDRLTGPPSIETGGVSLHESW